MPKEMIETSEARRNRALFGRLRLTTAWVHRYLQGDSKACEGYVNALAIVRHAVQDARRLMRAGFDQAGVILALLEAAEVELNLREVRANRG
jgi:hypothetical protein